MSIADSSEVKVALIGIIILLLVDFLFIGHSYDVPREHQVNELSGMVEDDLPDTVNHQLGVINRIYESSDGMSIEVTGGTIISGVQSGSILQVNINATLKVIHTTYLNFNTQKNILMFGFGKSNDYREVYATRYLCQEQFGTTQCYRIGKSRSLVQKVMIASGQFIEF